MSAYVCLDHLLKLLDDDSEVVRTAVQKELAIMRVDLQRRLEELDRPLSVDEERRVAQLLDPVRRDELEDTWMRWRWLDSASSQLEEGLAQISAFLAGWRLQSSDLDPRLDAVAQEAFDSQVRMGARELGEWLCGRGRDPAPFL